MNKEELRKLALDYHSQGKPGKITVNPTKSCRTGLELSLAYTPGVWRSRITPKTSGSTPHAAIWSRW